MRGALAVVLFCIGIFCLAQEPRAQLTMTGAGGGGFGVATSYVGPGDIASSAIEFASCGRAYSNAYASALSAACDVVDTATGLITGTFNFLSSGFVNKTQLSGAGQACQTACSVTKIYDETGHGNHLLQATLANMPGLTLSAQNGLPCAAGTGNAATILATVGGVTQAAPYTITAVGERTGTGRQDIFDNNGASASSFRWGAAANALITANATAVTLTAADSAFHAMLAVVSATAPLFAIDSSANTSTSTSGTSALSSLQTYAGRGSGVNGLQSGFVCEAGIWPADLNSSYQAMLANMRSATNGWNF